MGKGCGCGVCWVGVAESAVSVRFSGCVGAGRVVSVGFEWVGVAKM